MNPETGNMLFAEFSRAEFEDLLDRYQALSQIDQTVRRAINASAQRGYSEEHINTILMVGGSSLIPCIRKTVQRIFGRERVMLHRPLDAVARGAAAYVAGVDFFDHIQHRYCIRYVDPTRGEYLYREIVPQGTPYPTAEPVCRFTIKASHAGQTHLGIAIFEMGEHRRPALIGKPMELVFDPTGAARVVEVTPDEEHRRSHYWINEKSPTFLSADPPCKLGEPRFEVEFGIDSNKRLLITARDLNRQELTHKDFPVVKLT